MTLGEVLPKGIRLPIQWRVLFPTEIADSKEMLAGVCEWDGKELKSLDGDSYSLEEEIVGFLMLQNEFIYWTKGA